MHHRRTIAVALTVAVGALLTGSAGAGSQPGPTDRSVKLNLIAKLKRGPGILILGDSRGRQAEPTLLRELTGHTGFNAAVGGGSAPDAWVFTRYTADRFPNQKRRYLWFVSWGISSNIPDPRMEADPRGHRYLDEVASYLNPQTLSVPWQDHSHYRPDGSIADSQPASTSAQARKVRRQAAQIVAQIRRNPPVASPPDPARLRLFEHLIAYMTGLGARPVIVLNPIYPTVLAELEKYGSPLSTSSITYLHGLQQRYDFVFVDARDIRTWGGTDSDWENPTHIDRANMRRLLRYVVAHSDGALD